MPWVDLGPGLPGAPSLFADRPSRAGQPLTVSTNPVLNFVFVFDLFSFKSEFCHLHLVPQTACSLVLFSELVNAVFTDELLQRFPSIVPESHSMFLCSWNSFIFTAAHNYMLLTPHSLSVLVSMAVRAVPSQPCSKDDSCTVLYTCAGTSQVWVHLGGKGNCWVLEPRASFTRESHCFPSPFSFPLPRLPAPTAQSLPRVVMSEHSGCRLRRLVV